MIDTYLSGAKVIILSHEGSYGGKRFDRNVNNVAISNLCVSFLSQCFTKPISKIYNFSAMFVNLQAILFVYDITNQSTFDNLEDWWETVKSSLKQKDPSSMPVFALIANKGKK